MTLRRLVQKILDATSVPWLLQFTKPTGITACNGFFRRLFRYGYRHLWLNDQGCSTARFTWRGTSICAHNLGVGQTQTRVSHNSSWNATFGVRCKTFLDVLTRLTFFVSIGHYSLEDPLITVAFLTGPVTVTVSHAISVTVYCMAVPSQWLFSRIQNTFRWPYASRPEIVNNGHTWGVRHSVPAVGGIQIDGYGSKRAIYCS